MWEASLEKVRLYATSGLRTGKFGLLFQNIPPKPKKGSNLFFEVQIVSLT